MEVLILVFFILLLYIIEVRDFTEVDIAIDRYKERDENDKIK